MVITAVKITPKKFTPVVIRPIKFFIKMNFLVGILYFPGSRERVIKSRGMRW